MATLASAIFRQLQNMSMGSNEGFKEYAYKWRDLAGRVQPPLTNLEMVDMFMGTLIDPFFNMLIGSSSSGFTEMILIGKRIKSGINSGKILMATSLNAAKKQFGGKKEVNSIYGHKSRNKSNRHQSVGAMLISNPSPVQQ